MESATNARATGGSASSRRIVQRTRGKTDGPGTRLVSPSDIGQLIKPFVLLSHDALGASSRETFPLHPHSGIATLTALLQGSLRFQDRKGQPNSLEAGDIAWMQAGRGVWHGGTVEWVGPLSLLQLWIALPPDLELSAPSELLQRSEDIPKDGPARVLLGSLNGRESQIGGTLQMTYLHVRLSEGERWRYIPSRGHDVLWIAVYSGSLEAGEPVSEGELVVFDRSEGVVDFIAREHCDFVLGSAAQSQFDLVEGYYSVHTSASALQSGEQEIARLGAQMSADGRLTPERAAQVVRQMSGTRPGIR